MDPNAAACYIDHVLSDPDSAELSDAAYALRQLRKWIAQGGFAPDWKQYPGAYVAYRAAIRRERRLWQQA